MSQATPVPPMAMAAVPVSTNSMFSHDAITVQQTTRGCFQECFGCEAKSEYRVFPGHVEEGQPRKENIPQMGHLLEESGCLCRTCFSSQRGFTMKLAAGSLPADTEGAGPTVMVYEKPFSLPICCNIPMVNPQGEPTSCRVPCCCCLPKVNTKTPQGQLLGSSEYECDACLLVPKFIVKDENGNLTYRIKPETCCGGVCIKCSCSGGKASRMIYIPFIIRDPNTDQPIPSAFGEAHPSQIAKMWPGLKKGCCTDADNFHNIFLAGAPEPVKANLFRLAENACACIYTDTYTETLER